MRRLRVILSFWALRSSSVSSGLGLASESFFFSSVGSVFVSSVSPSAGLAESSAEPVSAAGF